MKLLITFLSLHILKQARANHQQIDSSLQNCILSGGEYCTSETNFLEATCCDFSYNYSEDEPCYNYKDK